MPVSAQHQAVLGIALQPLAADLRPAPGPIAVLPKPNKVFVDAVRAGGGEVAGLSHETRGVIWLSSKNAADLVGILHEHPGIGWVQLPWAGVDAFSDVLASHSEAERPLWTSAKGAYSQPVAEHALALALALLRVFPKRVVARSWASVREGVSLFGLNVLVIGAGGVTVELMRLLKPFGVHVTVVRRSTELMPGAERTLTSDHLLDVLPDADVVVVAAAFTADTAKLIGPEQLAAMKSTSVLVNIARGGLVDTDALVAALEARTIAGAGVDVTDPEPLPDGHPLWEAPNIIITPHSADTLAMTAPLLAERIRINVEAFLGDGRFVGIVDPKLGY
jgi:phosphoglycerate dehydrogenase-like enzyme